MKSTLRIVLYSGLMSIVAGAAFAQDSIAEQKARADLRLVEANIRKAEVEAFKAANSGIQGTTIVDALQSSADALLLTRMLYARMAGQLTDFVKGKVPPPQGEKVPPPQGENCENPIQIVFGSEPPSVAQYLAMQKARNLLLLNLDDAIKSWMAAKDKKLSAEFDTQLLSLPPLATAITAIGTLASLFRTDTTISGVQLEVPEAEFRAGLVRGLESEVCVRALPEISKDTSAADDLLASLKTKQTQALTLYRDEYLNRELERAKGDPKKVPFRFAQAAENLQTALSDYDALQRTLYTPVNGVLPAQVITEQRALHDAVSNTPILYVLSHRAAFTSITKRGLFGGGAEMKAAVSADFGLLVESTLPSDLKLGALTSPQPKRVKTAKTYLGSVTCVIGPMAPKAVSVSTLAATVSTNSGSKICEVVAPNNSSTQENSDTGSPKQGT